MLPMECSMWTCSKSDADDDLLANVQSLQNQLRRTEKNLQTVEKELSRYDCVWEWEPPVSCSITLLYFVWWITVISSFSAFCLNSLYEQPNKKNQSWLFALPPNTSTRDYYSHCFDEVTDVLLQDFVQPNYDCQGFSSCKKNSGRTSRQDFQRKGKVNISLRYSFLLLWLSILCYVLEHFWLLGME